MKESFLPFLVVLSFPRFISLLLSLSSYHIMFNPYGGGGFHRRRPYNHHNHHRHHHYGHGRGRRYNTNGIDPYLMMMLFRTLMQVLQQPHVPKVSLALAAVQLFLFFKPVPLSSLSPSLSLSLSSLLYSELHDVCIQPKKIIEGTW